MNLKTHVRTALTNLLSTKTRSFLAALGILVGTASVVAMVSGGELAAHQALKQFTALGTNLMAVRIDNQTESGSSTASERKISVDDAENIMRSSDEIIDVAPYINLYKPITFQGNKISGSIVGTTGDIAESMKLKVLAGRFISALDKNSLYCVLGNSVYNEIRRYTLDPIGQQLTIGKHIFTIIGATQPWIENSFVYANLDRSVFIPIGTALNIDEYAKISDIILELKKNSRIIPAQKSVQHYFDVNIPHKHLFFRSASQILKSMTAQKQIFTTFLGMIGSVSLLVGGIGIMNIMLVSVAERRQEIGIRLAVGAKRRDIQKMFMIESIILSFFGGLIGVSLGVLIAFFIAETKHWSFIFFLFPPTVGFSVSVTVGIFFGFYPAYKASKLDPITTLRGE